MFPFDYTASLDSRRQDFARECVSVSAVQFLEGPVMPAKPSQPSSPVYSCHHMIIFIFLPLDPVRALFSFLHRQYVARLALPPLQRAAAVPGAYAAQEPVAPLADEAARRGHGRARAAPDLDAAEDGTRGDGRLGDNVQHGVACGRGRRCCGGGGGAGRLRGAEYGLAGGGERGTQRGEGCECAVAKKIHRLVSNEAV